MNLDFTKPEVIAAFIAAGVSILNIIVTIIYSRKEIKADVVSKSRIEWIQNIIEYSSLFLGDLSKYKEYAKLSNIDNKEDYLNTIQSLNYHKEKLLLYFYSVNHKYELTDNYYENYKIDMNDLLYTELVENNTNNKHMNYFMRILIIKTFEFNYGEGNDFPEIITTFSEAFAKYIKIEWDRSKKLS